MAPPAVRRLGLVLASNDALSADLTAAQLMGMTVDAIPYLNLVREARGLDVKDIRVHPADSLKWARRSPPKSPAPSTSVSHWMIETEVREMKLQFLGHSCFLLTDGACRVLTDPFLTGNPLAAISADEAAADFIFVTHGHSDHTGDAVSIAQRTGATVCCTVDLADAVFHPANVQVQVGNLGGRIPMPFGSVKFFQAIHGSGVPGCLSCGFIFEMDGKKIYHAGDTALMPDMALLAEENIDVALLPIGDVFTMGPEDALRAVKLIQPKLVIPMHYNTFPPITQDADAFAATVREAGFQAKVLRPGESLCI